MSNELYTEQLVINIYLGFDVTLCRSMVLILVVDRQMLEPSFQSLRCHCGECRRGGLRVQGTRKDNIINVMRDARS